MSQGNSGGDEQRETASKRAKNLMTTPKSGRCSLSLSVRCPPRYVSVLKPPSYLNHSIATYLEEPSKNHPNSAAGSSDDQNRAGQITGRAHSHRG